MPCGMRMPELCWWVHARASFVGGFVDPPLFWISISFLFKSQRMPHAHARALLVGFCWWVRARALLVGSW